MSCKYCEDTLNKINSKHPNADWNLDKACSMWQKLKKDIPNNNIKFEDGADENYGCTCPACGKLICGWCV